MRDTAMACPVPSAKTSRGLAMKQVMGAGYGYECSTPPARDPAAFFQLLNVMGGSLTEILTLVPYLDDEQLERCTTAVLTLAVLKRWSPWPGPWSA